MKKNWKRMLSLLLVLVMLAGMFPTSALAVDETVTVTFVCDETVPNVTVYDADGDVISSGRGDHHLAPGSYYYSAEADGYEPHVMRPFVIPEDNGAYQGLYITMTPKEQKPVAPAGTVSVQEPQGPGNPEDGQDNPSPEKQPGEQKPETVSSTTVSLGKDEEKNELLQIQVTGGNYPNTDPAPYRLLEQDESLKGQYIVKLSEQLDEGTLTTREIVESLSLVVVENNEDKKPVTLRQPEPKDPEVPREPVHLAVSGEWMNRFAAPVFAAWSNGQFDLIDAEQDEDGVWQFDAAELSLLMIVDLSGAQPRTVSAAADGFTVVVSGVQKGAELTAVPVAEETLTAALAPLFPADENADPAVPAFRTPMALELSATGLPENGASVKVTISGAALRTPGAEAVFYKIVDGTAQTVDAEWNTSVGSLTFETAELGSYVLAEPNRLTPDPVKVTVNYVDAAGEALLPAEEMILAGADEERTENLPAPEIEGYAVLEESRSLTIPAWQAEPMTATLVYAPATTLTVYYVDTLDQALSATEVRPLPILDKEQTITFTAPEVAGFTVDEETLTLTVPANQTEPVLHRVVYRVIERKIPCEQRSISAAAGNRTVTVSGMLPVDAELSVVVIPLKEAEAIFSAQLGESASEQQIVFAYDVSILSNGEKYDLEEYGDSVTMSVSDLNVENLTVTHVKIDVTDGNGGLDGAALNAAKTEKQATETVEAGTVGGEVFFDLTSCSVVTFSVPRSLGARNGVNYDEAFQNAFEAKLAQQRPLIYPVITNITVPPVVSGDKLAFEAEIHVKEMPSYLNGDGEWIHYFNGYENVTAQIKLPAGLFLDVRTLPQGSSLISPTNPDYDLTTPHTYLIQLNDGYPLTGQNITFSFNVLIGGNGTEKSIRDISFADDMFTVSADYTLIGQNGETATDPEGNPKVYHESNSATTEGISTTSDDEWLVKKSIVEEETGYKNGVVTYTWLVRVGLKESSGDLVNLETDYGRPGRDQVTEMTIGDVIKTLLVKSASDIIDVTNTDARTSFTIEKYTSDETFGPAVTLSNSDAQNFVIWKLDSDGVLDTDAVNSDLVLNYGTYIDANRDGTNDTVTPVYTQYRVTATYQEPADGSWHARYPESTQYVLRENNTASIHTEFAKLEAQDRSGNATKDVPLPLDGAAKLNITKEFRDNNENLVDYNNRYGRIPYWISAGENFTVYNADNTIATDADGVAMTGKKSYEIVSGKDYYLVPLVEYTVEERMTAAQENAMDQTDNPKAKVNTPAPGSPWPVTFHNKETLGKLIINKKDDYNRPMSDSTQVAGFTLFDSSGTAVGAEQKTVRGVATFNNLLYGTYTLKETTTPEGYAPAPDLQVTIDADHRTVERDVINTQNKSSLVLEKYVGTTQEKIKDFILAAVPFEEQFQLQRSTDKVTWENVDGFDKLTGGRKTLVLDAFAATDVPYWYRYVETLPEGYYDPVTGATTGTVESDPVQLAELGTDGHWHAIPRASSQLPTITMYNRQLMSVKVMKNFYTAQANGRTSISNTAETKVTLWQTTDSSFATAPTRVQDVGEPDDGKTVKSNSTANADCAIWNGLKAYDDAGNKIYYLVKEKELQNYALDVSQYMSGTANTANIKQIGDETYVLVPFTDTAQLQQTRLYNVEQVVPAVMWKRDTDSNNPLVNAVKVSIYELNEDGTVGAPAVNAHSTATPQATYQNIPIQTVNSSGTTFYLELGKKYVYLESIEDAFSEYHLDKYNISYSNITTPSGTPKEKTIDGVRYGFIDLSKGTQTYSARNTNKNATATIYNRKDPLIQIKKVDSASASTVLAGVEYKVYQKSGDAYVPYPNAAEQYTITTTNPASPSTVALPAGETFYFAEVSSTLPAGYLDPNVEDNYTNYYSKLNPTGGTPIYIWVDGIGTLAAGDVTNQIVDGKNVCEFTFKNVKNAGDLKVRKYLDGKLQNGFTITLSATVDGVPYSSTATSQGEKTESGKVTDLGEAVFASLPVYNSDGTLIQYTVGESMSDDQAKRYHKDSDDLTGITLTVGETTEYVAGSDSEYLAVYNSTRVSYTAKKVFVKPFEYGYTQYSSPYGGAMIGLFVEDEDGNWKLVDARELSDGGTNPRASESDGSISFEGLVRGKNYKLIELSAGTGEGSDSVFPYVNSHFGEFPANGVDTTSISATDLASHTYNVIDITKESIEDTTKTAFPADGSTEEMVNANHWVQFHVTKYLDPGQTHQQTLPSQDVLDTYQRVDNVIFDLYRYVMPGDEGSVAYPGEGWQLVNSYTTGTLYNGTERLPGEFLSDSEQGINDHYVYLLVERDEGPNSIVKNPYFTYSFWQEENHHYTITLDPSTDVVVNNLTYTIDDINDADILDTSPSGPGGDLFLLGSVRIAKWKDSFNEKTGQPEKNYQPLPGAQFTLSLPDGTLLETMTVGLDAVMHPDGQASAQSATYLIEKGGTADNPTYSLYNYESGKTIPVPAEYVKDPFEFTFGGKTYKGLAIQTRLKETYSPDGFSPEVGGFMDMWFCFADITTGGEGQSWLFNDAYYVMTGGTGTTEQLAANQSTISWYVTNASSEDYINPVSVGDTTNPSPLRIVNYPMDNTLVRVVKYGYQPSADTLKCDSAALDDMNPEAISRKELNGVQMVIQKYVDDDWTFWNYRSNKPADAETAAAFTTSSDGSYLFPEGLSEGTYRIYETSIGDGNSSYEMAYTSARPREFTVTKAVVNLSMYNPKKFGLHLEKQDMDGNPVNVSGFTLKTGSSTITPAVTGNKTDYSNLATGIYTLTENFAGYSNAYLSAYLAAKYPAYAALFGSGMKLGYDYKTVNGDVVIDSVLPNANLIAKDSDGKDTFVITVQNPKLTNIELTKTDEDGATITEQAQFVVRYKAFSGLTFGETADQVTVQVPVAGESSGQTDWTGWTSVGNTGTYNTNNGKITLNNLKPGVYAFYESTAPAGYDFIRDTSGKKIIFTVVVTGGLNVDVTVDPDEATIYRYGSSGRTEDTIPISWQPEDGTAASIRVENRLKTTVKAKKTPNPGELTLTNSNRWSVTLYLYDSNAADASPVAGVTINQGTDQQNALTFKTLGSSGAPTSTDALFSYGTQYYLGETVTVPTQVEQFPWVSYTIDGEKVTVTDPTAKVPVSISSTKPITVEVENQWLYGEVRFKKIDKDEASWQFISQHNLEGAKFEEISYKNSDGDWVVIPNAKAEYDATLHMYVAKNIPLASAAPTEYRIKETRAPNGYLLKPDTYLYVTLSAENNLIDETDGKSLPNSKGDGLSIFKLSKTAGPDTSGATRFAVYHKIDGVWVQEEAGYTSTTDGKYTFSKLMVPGDEYGIAEVSFNPGVYSRLEGIYQQNTQGAEEELTPEGTVTFTDDSGATKDVDLYILNHESNNVSVVVYNIAKVNPVIRKLDVGQYLGGNETYPNTRVPARMHFAIYQLTGDDVNISTDEQVQEFLDSAPTPVYTGETGTYDATALQNGTQVEWAGDGTEGKAAWDNRYTYLIVETEVSASEGTYDTMRKDDPDVVWYYKLNPVADSDVSADMLPIDLKNSYGDASVTLTKSADKEKVDSLLTGSRDVVYTLTPSFKGHNQMLKSFVLKETGITATAKDPANADATITVPVDYVFNSIHIGKATHSVDRSFGASFPISATVTYYDAAGAKIEGADVTVDHLESQAADLTSSAGQIPANARSFDIAYYSSALRTATEQKCHDTYALGEEFSAEPVTVAVTVQQQDGGSLGSPVDVIKDLENKAIADLRYWKWDSKGTGTTEAGNEFPATADVAVDPIKLPRVSITKTSSYDSTRMEATLPYEITISNMSTSSEDFVNPVVMDILPTEVSYVKDSAPKKIMLGERELTVTTETFTGDPTYSSTHVGEDGQPISGNAMAVVFQIGGTLRPGESITIPFTVRVPSSAEKFADIVGGTKNLVNDAYLSSSTKSFYTRDNPLGRSFLNGNGDYAVGLAGAAASIENSPSATRRETAMHGHVGDYSNGDLYGWIPATKPVSLSYAQSIHAVKAVMGDRDTQGFHTEQVGVVSRTNSARSESVGWAQWSLSVVNSYPQKEFRNIVIGDVIPNPGDGTERLSQFELYFDDILLVQNAGEDLSAAEYTVYAYTGATDNAESVMLNAMENRDYSAFTPLADVSDRTKVTAFIIVFDPTVVLRSNSDITVIYNTTVPDITDDTEFAKIAFSNNTNLFWYTFNNEDRSYGSNKVTITISDRPVEIQGDLWVDEDQDGVQESGGNRRSYDNYEIIQKLLEAIKFSITDNRSAASGSIPDTGALTQHSGGESIKHFRFEGLGAATWKLDVTDEDQLYISDGSGSRILDPGKLKGRDPYNYTVNALINDADVLAVLGISPRGSNHFRSDDPDAAGFATSANALDNNFSGSSGAYSTYPFFIRYSESVDQSKDLGVMLFRDLEITKVAADSADTPVAGAKFSVYGPFGDSALDIRHTPGSGSALKFVKNSDGVYTLNPEGTVTQLETGADGKLKIIGLNWWKEYDIKEVQAAPGYTLDSITATGDSGTYTEIVSTTDATTFTLKVPGTRKVDRTDKVTVTNRRSVDVPLNVYKLLETLPEDDSIYKFKFDLRLFSVPTGTETINQEALNGNPIETIEIAVQGNSLGDGKGGALDSFAPVKLYGAGIYVFKIYEQQTDSFHGTLDLGPKKATVTVVWDDTAKALKVDAIQYEDTWTSEDGTVSAEKFTNIYKPNSVKVVIPVTKTLAGDTPAKNLTFNFLLERSSPNNAPMPEGEGNKTSITVTPTKPTDSSAFGEITYKLPGTYVYKVTETAGSDTHIRYADTEYTVTVTVADGTGEHAGELVASYKVTPEAGEDHKTLLFTNTYTPDPVKLKIPVEKTVTGDSVPSNAETFTFKLERVSPETAPLPSTGTSATVTTTGTGTGLFDAINFEHAGTYTYKVSETEGSNSHYAYDKTYWTVEVTVADTEEEKLQITGYVLKQFKPSEDETPDTLLKTITATGTDLPHDTDNICTPTLNAAFINPYTPDPVPLEIPVKKLVNKTPGSKEPDATFTFDLAKVGTAPMPEADGETVTVTWPTPNEGKFGTITFVKAGTYQYTVTERQGNTPGMHYDTTPRNVTVTVTVGTNDKLTASYTVSVTKTENGQEVTTTVTDEPIVITNDFDEPKVDVEIEKIWDDDDDQDAIRPESITVTLKRSYTKVDGTVVKDETVPFSQGDANQNPAVITKATKIVDGKEVEVWEHKWEKLPKYMEMTQLITYSVTEAEIVAPAGFEEGYEASYQVDPANPTAETTKFSITVTNTHEPERIDFEFTKLGEDVPAEGSTATESTYSPLEDVEFTLYTDPGCTTVATKPADTAGGAPVELKAKSGADGVVKFKKIPMYKVTTAEDGTQQKVPMVYYMMESDLGTANQDIFWDNSTIYKLEVVPKTATEPAKIVMTEVAAAAAGGGSGGTAGENEGDTGTAADGSGAAAAETPEPIRTGKLVTVTGEDGKVAYSIQNDLVKYKVKLLKLDEKDKIPLKDAEFALYKKGDLVEATAAEGTSAEGTSAEGTPAEGAAAAKPKWVPKEGAQPVKTGIKTNEAGEAELGWISRNGKLWLLPGEYELLETKAPDAYFPIEDPISIKIEKGKATYQQPGATEATVLTLDNVASFTVKVTDKPKYGDLKIIKYLPTYEMSEEATFIFDVVGTDPKDSTKIVYTNVAILTLTTDGSRFAVLQHIPDGAHIVVTERYTGSHYELDSAAERTTTIVANRTVSVNFKNRYNYYDNGGHGLANVFKPTTDGGWVHDGKENQTSTPADQPLDDYVPTAENPGPTQELPGEQEGEA